MHSQGLQAFKNVLVSLHLLNFYGGRGRGLEDWAWNCHGRVVYKTTDFHGGGTLVQIPAGSSALAWAIKHFIFILSSRLRKGL